jgi:hypothetical protein
MKKNLFEINSGEVQRILSLHEDRSKNQYLNIISEQDNQKFETPTYSLSQDQIFLNNDTSGGGKYYVLAKTKFQSTSDPSIVRATNASVNKWVTGWEKDKNHDISFYCKKNQFFFSNDKRGFTNKIVADKLRPLCGKVGYQSVKAKAGTTFTQNYDEPFTNMGTQQLSITIVKGSVWTWDGKIATTKNTMSGGITTSGIKQTSDKLNVKLGLPTFSCTPTKGSYITVSGVPHQDNTQKLTKDLRKTFCFSKVQNSANTDTSTQPKVQQKSNFTALYTIQNNHDLGKTKVNVKDIIIKSTKFPDYAAIMRGNTPIAYYNCKTNAWNDNINVVDSKGALTGTIKEKVCPQVLSPTPVVDPNNPNSQQVVGTNAQQTVTPNAQQTVTPNAQQAVTPNTQQVNRQQQFAQRTVTAINNVQKTLGVPQTGQLKNSDIEDLLNKLK